MDKWMKTGIKTVITEFPEVGEILNSFNIGCTTCSPGSCLLGDVVGIHNLSAEDEAELMYQIERAIYPDKEVIKPEVGNTGDNGPKEISYCPPIKELVDEHKLIKRWLALIPRVVEILEEGKRDIWQQVQQGALFTRYYADKFHHAKEEEVLFKLTDESSDIIQIMCEDHVEGRRNVTLILEAVEEKNSEKAIRHLMAFRELLSEHIKKEDEILFPWIERQLSDSQIGKLFIEFSNVNKEMEEINTVNYVEVISQLEKDLL